MTAGNAQVQNGLTQAAPAPAVEWADAQGQTRITPLSRAGLTVGSATGNAIELSGDTIARYHLRIDWDGRQVLVTSLSTKGSSIGATVLAPPPATGVVWDGTAPLLVGAYRLRLSRAMPVAQATTVAASTTTLEIRLEGDAEHLELTPGGSETVKARILNRSTSRETVRVSVEGLNPEWVRVAPETVQPGPNLPAIVVISVNVPRESGSRAGSFPVTIRARGERGETERSLRWEIASFAEHTLELRPARAEVANEQPASYSVGVRNTGNATMSYDLHAGYDDPALEYRLERTSFVVEPGKEQRVALRVQARERLSSREQVHHFSVESVPASGLAQVGSLAYARRRQVPLWVWLVALGTLILLFGLTGRVMAGILSRPTPTAEAAALAGTLATGAPPANTDTTLPPTAMPFPTFPPFPPSETPDIGAITQATQTAAAFVNQVGTAQAGGTAAVDAALEAAQQAGSTAAALAAAAVGEQAQQAAAAQAQQAAQQAANAAAVESQVGQGVAGTTRAMAAQTEQAAPVAALQTTVAVLQFTPTSTPTSTQTSTPTSTPTETPQPTPAPQTDLRIRVQGSANPVAAGGVLTYTIRVDNLGANQAVEVQISSQLPGNVAISDADLPADLDCGISTGLVLCRVPTLNPGANIEFALPVRVQAADGTLVNTVRVSSATRDTVPANDFATVTTTVAIATDLEITISASNQTVGAGQPLTYTLTLTNRGGNPATLPNVFTELSVGNALSGVAGTPGWGCTPTGRQVVCNSGNALAPQGVVTFTLRITAPATVPASGVLTATTTTSSAILDPNPENSKDTVTTALVKAADLSIGLTAQPDPVLANRSLAYTVSIDNAGPSDSSFITVTLTLPQGPLGVSYQSGDGDGWDCSGGNPIVTCIRDTPDEEIALTDEIPAITVVVMAPLELATLTTTATVSSAILDPSLGNNSFELSEVDVTPDAELSVELSAPPGPLRDGSTFTYRATVTNRGPSTATNVELVIELDNDAAERVTYVEFSAQGGWGCTHDLVTNQFTCLNASLTRGEAEFSVRVQAPTNPGNGELMVSSIARVTSPTDRTAPAEDSADTIIYLRPAIPVIQPLDRPQPGEQPLTVGAQVTLVVNPSGTDLEYRWYGRFAGGSFILIPGATQITHTPPPFPIEGIYQYYIEVYNNVGSVTSRVATVTVNPPLLP